MTRRYTLTPQRIEILKDVLRPYADKIESVGVFGSHALATARPNSDIDLVIYGTLTQAEIDRIWTSLDDSILPVTVDVAGYDLPLYAPLRAHIDRTMKTLFTKDDLLVEAIR